MDSVRKRRGPAWTSRHATVYVGIGVEKRDTRIVDSHEDFLAMKSLSGTCPSCVPCEGQQSVENVGFQCCQLRKSVRQVSAVRACRCPQVNMLPTSFGAPRR